MSLRARTSTRPSPIGLGAVRAVVLPRRLVAPRHRRVVAEGELAAPDEPPVGGERAQVRAHLVDAGEPLGQALGDGLAHRLVEAGVVGRRLGSLDQALRGIHEKAGGLAARVADDDAARRIRRCGGRSRRRAGRRS